MRCCPNRCTSQTSAADKFCYKCGSALVEGIVCECGRELGMYDRFCPTCGKPVERGGGKVECNDKDGVGKGDEGNVAVS